VPWFCPLSTSRFNASCSCSSFGSGRLDVIIRTDIRPFNDRLKAANVPVGLRVATNPQ